MQKIIKYFIGILLLLVVAYNSIYFKKLDAMKAAAAKDFDAKSYARKYFNDKLVPALNSAIELNQLLALLHKDKEKTFDQYSHALGIGNIRFFLIKGEGKIVSVNENDITVVLRGDSTQKNIRIATEFVFGNAIRDASGLIDINEFRNTMDFNNVSAEINSIVRNEVLPPFKNIAKKDQVIQFAGAIELNRVHLNLQQIEVVPVSLNVKE
jgi:predicted lipoprotein